jgi:hypothetical protein
MNMSEFDAEEFLSSIDPKSTEDIDRAFAALAKELPETEYKDAIDAIEAALVGSVADI